MITSGSDLILIFSRSQGMVSSLGSWKKFANEFCKTTSSCKVLKVFKELVDSMKELTKNWGSFEVVGSVTQIFKLFYKPG